LNGDQLQHVAGADRGLLLFGEAEFFHVAVLVRLEGGAVAGVVEGKTHLVQGVALARFLAAEDRSARYVPVVAHGSLRWVMRENGRAGLAGH